MLVCGLFASVGDTVGTAVGTAVGEDSGKLALVGDIVGTAVGNLVEVVGAVEEFREASDRVGTTVPLLTLSSEPKVMLDAVEFNDMNSFSGSVIFEGRSDELVNTSTVEFADPVELATVTFS